MRSDAVVGLSCGLAPLACCEAESPAWCSQESVSLSVLPRPLTRFGQVFVSGSPSRYPSTSPPLHRPGILVVARAESGNASLRQLRLPHTGSLTWSAPECMY